MCGLFGYEGNVKNLPDFETEFRKLIHRGPDDTRIVHFADDATLAFHRLAIMDTSHHGDQPLKDLERDVSVVCNGEIYNFQQYRDYYETSYPFVSHSDCEVLLPLYRQYGLQEMCKRLDAEFAFVLWDNNQKKIFAARDPIGIRPLFWGKCRRDGKIMFASEAKVIENLCDQVRPFPPGHYYADGEFISYRDVTKVKTNHDSDATILKNIRELLVEGVRKRLVSDVPVGYLLSGGLDSSLVCGIAAKMLGKKITTFSVGLNHNPIDLPYAKKVADFIQSNHHEVFFDQDQTINSVRDVIWHLETWDITTIRASIGMYLVCKYVHDKTPIKVLLTGEISDELFGYKYTDFAPSGDEFQREAKKRMDELYMYDVLRADRCLSANSIEARVPFGDLDFAEYVMSIPGEKKMNTTGMGKFLLREAFKGTGVLPDEILWREKAAFSDAVGHSMVDYLKAHAEKMFTDQDVQNAKYRYPHGTPFTKESLWYRTIFEEFYPNKSNMIKDFWMPNKEWANCNVSDPSARVLPNYGKSGQ